MPNTTRYQKRLQVPEETEKKDKRAPPLPPPNLCTSRWRQPQAARIPLSLLLRQEKAWIRFFVLQGRNPWTTFSLLQLQSKMERTAFRAWNHWTSLSPLFLPFALARSSSSVEPKAKMERSIDNTLVLDKGSKRTRTISLPFNSEQVQVNQEERRLPSEGEAKGKGQSSILEGASSIPSDCSNMPTDNVLA